MIQAHTRRDTEPFNPGVPMESRLPQNLESGTYGKPVLGKPAPSGWSSSEPKGFAVREELPRDWAKRMYRTPPAGITQDPLPLDERLVEACAPAALKLGGPRLTRLGITSALRGEGRTSIALAMAAVQARAFGRRALLVDADFDHPTLGEAFGHAGEPGLAEVTTGEVSVDNVIHEIGEGVALLPAGQATRHRSRMVRELLNTDLLSELAAQYEVAIVDLPPLLGTTDGPLLAGQFDTALLIVRAQITPLARIQEAVSLLPKKPFVLVNAVRSDVPGWLNNLVYEK